MSLAKTVAFTAYSSCLRLWHSVIHNDKPFMLM